MANAYYKTDTLCILPIIIHLITQVILLCEQLRDFLHANELSLSFLHAMNAADVLRCNAHVLPEFNMLFILEMSQ